MSLKKIEEATRRLIAKLETPLEWMTDQFEKDNYLPSYKFEVRGYTDLVAAKQIIQELRVLLEEETDRKYNSEKFHQKDMFND